MTGVDGSNDHVTVVIPARNAAATLAAQLRALDAQLGDVTFSVVVVDNGSTDDTATVARGHRSDRYSLRVVDEVNAGVNWARNAGIAAAPDGLVLLCDADDEVRPGWVSAMAAACEPGTWVGGVVDYAALNSPRTRLQWGAPVVSSVVEPGPTAEGEPYADRTFGCACGFHRSMWEELGGFDHRLSGIGGDETEFFTRAHAAGYRPRAVPAAVVAYRLRPGVVNMCRQRFRQGRQQVRWLAIAGDSNRPLLPDRPTTRRALVKVVVAAPRYLWSARARYQWMASVSRHLGRLTGYRSLAGG